MKIKVGEYDVLDSGTIVSIEDEPIDFVLVENIGYTIRIVFENDYEDKSSRMKGEPFDKVGAKLTLINFNSIGVGNVKPLQIGTLNHRELFLNYRVYSLDKGAKTFHYIWLLGKEVKNGN
jgi:hypothetical protein